MRTSNILLILFLITPLFLSAQKGKSKKQAREEKKAYEANLKYYNQIFEANDKDFELTEAPEKWKAEPIVMLCQKTHISFLKNGFKSNETKGVVRKRVLIQDKASVESFSEFYYQNSSAFGIQHIKPDGTKKEIDLKNAVKVESDVPSFYADSYQTDDYKKIAIPNLEAGDILDYFKVFTQEYNGEIELITAISYSYPVVEQEIIFDVDKQWNFYYNTFNGAPSFRQDETGGLDIKGRKKKSVKRFVLKDSNRPAQKEERWDYFYLTEPIFKIMALAPNSFLGGKKKKNDIATEVNVKDIFASAMNSGESIGASLTKSSKKRLKSIQINKMSGEEKINAIYNVVRFEFIKSSLVYQDYLKTRVVTAENLELVVDNYFSMNSNVFAAVFSNVLFLFDEDAEVVAVVPRYFGDITEVITEEEMQYGVYISGIDKYYWTTDIYRNPVENYYRMAGASGYKISRKGLRKKNPQVKSITVPSSHADENVSHTDMEIKVNDDNSFDIKSKIQYTGKYKERYNSLFLFQTPILEEDYDKLSSDKDNVKTKERRAKLKKGKKGKTYKRFKKKKKERDAKEKETKTEKEELSTKKRDAIEGWLKGDFELKKLKYFEVTSYGRFPENKNLAIETKFTAEGYLQKAGPNLIFNVGKLISGQIELTDDEIKERTKPVEIDYAHTIENEFIITLPEGYKAQGLETLNLKVDNKHAAFISEANQEGNILTVKTSKIYKSEMILASDWNMFVEMLEAAYKFSQTKIILKK